MVASLEKWLMKAASYIKDYYNNLGENDHSQKIRSNTVNYLKQARITRGKGTNLTDPVDEDANPVDQSTSEGSTNNILCFFIFSSRKYLNVWFVASRGGGLRVG